MAKISSKQLGTALARKISSLKGESEKKAYLQKVAELIAKEGKISKLSTVIKSFEKEWNTLEGVIDVKITVASKEDAKFSKEIGDKKVNLKVKEDPSLIAGAQIVVGDYISDNTVKARIGQLKALAK
ncbi:MAG: synthase subunit delta [Patescibacteria group bacterium]|jgi:F0F1-type ATP synthase delta subunit|nr:synthase subunit delta [Patescibacteria group bacterium]